VLATLEEAKPGVVAEPELLFTEREWQQVQERLALAGKLPETVAS